MERYGSTKIEEASWNTPVNSHQTGLKQLSGDKKGNQEQQN